jgi:hypothetical protein
MTTPDPPGKPPVIPARQWRATNQVTYFQAGGTIKVGELVKSHQMMAKKKV